MNMLTPQSQISALFIPALIFNAKSWLLPGHQFHWTPAFVLQQHFFGSKKYRAKAKFIGNQWSDAAVIQSQLPSVVNTYFKITSTAVCITNLRTAFIYVYWKSLYKPLIWSTNEWILNRMWLMLCCRFGLGPAALSFMEKVYLQISVHLNLASFSRVRARFPVWAACPGVSRGHVRTYVKGHSCFGSNTCRLLWANLLVLRFL